MASAEFTEESKQKRPNVQVGDPFLEKLLLEACLEAMKTGAIVAIQDMGAAGLTSSSCEMGSRGGVGIEIDLDLVPQRETGMTAYEMLLSESQERMLLVAEKGREDEVFQVFRKWGLDAVTIGVVTADGQAARAASRQNRRRNSQSARWPMKPRATTVRTMSAAYRNARHRAARSHSRIQRSATPICSRLIASPDLCSKRWIWEQYDYRSAPTPSPARAPTPPSCASRKPALPIAMSLDGNGRYCYLDPREGAKLAVAECCRNLATTGAVPVAATN